MLSREELLAELLAERFGPTRLPPPTPPHPVDLAVLEQATPPDRPHLVALPGGRARTAAA